MGVLFWVVIVLAALVALCNIPVYVRISGDTKCGLHVAVHYLGLRLLSIRFFFKYKGKYLLEVYQIFRKKEKRIFPPNRQEDVSSKGSSRLLRSVLAAARVERADIRLQLGTGDAMWDAMLGGLAWIGFDIFFAVISNPVYTARVQVNPDFSTECFSIAPDCIISATIADIYIWRRKKKGSRE